MKYIYRYAVVSLMGIGFSIMANADVKSMSLSISATLESTCLAGTGASGNILFGTLDFGSQVFLNQRISASSIISVTCNVDMPYNVLLGSGNSSTTASRYMVKNATGEQIQYNLFVDAAYSTIWDNQTGVSGKATGGAQTLNVYGLVPAQSTPSSGIYTDTVIVTVNW